MNKEFQTELLWLIQSLVSSIDKQTTRHAKLLSKILEKHNLAPKNVFELRKLLTDAHPQLEIATATVGYDVAALIEEIFNDK